MMGSERDPTTRSVVLVTYYFPPSGGPGVQRMLKFAKYLPEFGWKPLVLTVREDAEYPVLDPSLWKDVPPGTPIVRTGAFELYRLYRRIGGGTGPVDIRAREQHEGVPRRILRALRATLFVPDGRVGWIPYALGPGTRLARDEGAAAILSSGPPFTANLIGGLLHRRTGLPWIQDFRDPWTRAPFYPDRPGPVRRLDEKLEAWTIRTAARTLAVNQGILSDFRERIPRIDTDRLMTLPNGFDEADFEGIPRSFPEKMTVVHTGSLFAARDPWALRTALAELCRREDHFAETFELVLAGRNDLEIEKAFRAPPFDRIVRFAGYLPHHECLRLLRSADLNLLLVGREKAVRGMLTGKVFEYLGSETAILALLPEGEARDLIERTRAGIVVDPEDPEALRVALLAAWRRFRAGERRYAIPDPLEIARYGRRELTRRLAGILDDVVVTVGTRSGG